MNVVWGWVKGYWNYGSLIANVVSDPFTASKDVAFSLFRLPNTIYRGYNGTVAAWKRNKEVFIGQSAAYVVLPLMKQQQLQ